MPGKQLSQQEINRELQRDQYAQASGSTGEQRRVTAVVAFNAADFDQWCKANGKNPRDRNLLMVTAATARGLQNAHLEVTGRGMWRADIHALMVALVPMLDRPSQQRLAGMGWGQPIP
ncbi:MAG: hypothetical protein WC273_00860 [Dehalococcoidia bacterium]